LSINSWVWLGKKSGTISLIVFWIVLLPGMMKRFQIVGWLLPIRTILMLYRRQLGVTMYTLALAHYWWVRMLPILSVGGNIWLFSPFEIMGLTAFSLLTPLFFTSNDWSVKYLGQWWNKIHSLVYVVIWLLFLHISLQSVGWKAFITLIVAALELFSLIWANVLRPKN
jgi:sulfoxide reductase heme-binding subunit YedZ